MLDEPEHIRRLAQFLCVFENPAQDPCGLRAGNVAYHSSFDPEAFNNGDIDWLFDEKGNDYDPDGVMPNGDPGMFRWRDAVPKAIAILQFLDSVKKES